MTASVTGCSTWIRAFSSRKKNSRPETMNSAVPALPVADRGRRTAPLRRRAQLAARRRTAGDGDSSSTFWWRRWIEHSRSPSDTVSVRSRARSCTSTCRAVVEVALEEDRPVAEGRLASRSAASRALVELRRRPHDPHPAAAASRRGLDEQRVADLAGLAGRERRHARRRRRSASLRACRRRPGAPRAAARSRRARLPRPPRPARRSRRGTRSRDGQRRLRSRARRERARPRRGSSRSRPSRRRRG